MPRWPRRCASTCASACRRMPTRARWSSSPSCRRPRAARSSASCCAARKSPVPRARRRRPPPTERGTVMQIDNSVFLISGGGSGLGLATARELVGAGARVVLADIDAAAARAAALELGAAALAVACDVTCETQVQAAVDAALAQFGALHGVVSCAGVAPAEKLLGRDGVHDLARFRRVIEINLSGTFNLLRLGAEAMARNAPNADGERGVIVNTASVAAFDGQIGQCAYAASKGAVVAMTLPLARELAREAIRVM